jgi:cytochrome c oxidase subunit 4
MANTHATHTDPHDTARHHGVGHIVPPKILIATAAALLVLTVITVWIAQFDFGAGNIYVALGIAALKASLVVLFFMHLRWDRPFNSIVFVGSLFLVALFITFAMTDSLEYKPEVIQGNASKVKTELDALKSETAAPVAPTATDHGAAPEHEEH